MADRPRLHHCSNGVQRAGDRVHLRCVSEACESGVRLESRSVAAVSLTRASLWMFTALYTVAGLAFAGHGPQPYIKAIAGWIDKKRGLALGTAMTGVGIGIILVPQLARYLIGTFGWRHAYLGLGVVVFAVAFPAVAAFVRDAPGDPAQNEPLSRARAP